MSRFAKECIMIVSISLIMIVVFTAYKSWRNPGWFGSTPATNYIKQIFTSDEEQQPSETKVSTEAQSAEQTKQIEKEAVDKAKQAFMESKDAEVSVRDLLAYSSKYIGKQVKVGPLKVGYNHLERKAFTTYASTGPKPTDKDYEAEIGVFYDKVSNLDACVNLSYKDSPTIYVSGTVKPYIDADNKYYIEANSVWVSE